MTDAPEQVYAMRIDAETPWVYTPSVQSADAAVAAGWEVVDYIPAPGSHVGRTRTVCTCGHLGADHHDLGASLGACVATDACPCERFDPAGQTLMGVPIVVDERVPERGGIAVAARNHLTPNDGRSTPQNTREDRIDVGPVRDAYVASRRSAASVAEGAGMTRQGRRAGSRSGDATALLRALGLRANGSRPRPDTIDRDLATRICREIGADPVDVGL